MSVDVLGLIKYEEGYRSVPYLCSEGYPTIGYGTKICGKDVPLSSIALRVNRAVAEAMLQYELDVTEYEVKSLIRDNSAYVNSYRYAVLLSMGYQLGVTGLKNFKRMWAAISKGDWATASAEALDSLWARQTPNRAKRHAAVLRDGTFEAYAGLL